MSGGNRRRPDWVHSTETGTNYPSGYGEKHFGIRYTNHLRTDSEDEDLRYSPGAICALGMDWGHSFITRAQRSRGIAGCPLCADRSHDADPDRQISAAGSPQPPLCNLPHLQRPKSAHTARGIVRRFISMMFRLSASARVPDANIRKSRARLINRILSSGMT